MDSFDFMSLFSSPHAPLVWAKEVLEGTPEDIGPSMPLQRSIKGILGLMGIDWNNSPLNIEGRIREHFGLHPFDRWDDYRVDRMLANMAADGEFSLDMVLRAMIDRQGPVYDEAIRRANVEFGVGALGSALGLPTKAYPEGEEHLRELKDEYEAAWQAYEDSGENYDETIGEFLENNPGYEARLALWKEPQERLQNFLVDEIWDRYNDMPTIDKWEVREQLGREFEQLFLSRETRSYESIPNEMMQMWLKMIGGDPPGSFSGVAVPIEFAPPEVAWRAQAFFEMRDQMFDYNEVLRNTQEQYFKLSTSARRQFRAQHPELVQYWAWRRDFFMRNPDVVPYLDEDFEFNYESVQQMLQATQQPGLTPEEMRFIMTRGLFEKVMGGADLGEFDYAEVYRIAQLLGVTPDAILQMGEP